MADTVFSCGCGMILKVLGGAQAGEEIICPACSASVPVPLAGRAEAVPLQGDPMPEEGDPEGSKSHMAGVIYASVTLILTICASIFLLFPAMNRSDEVVKKAAVEEKSPDKPAEKKSPRAASEAVVKRPPKRAPVRPEADSELPEYTSDSEPPKALAATPAPTPPPSQPSPPKPEALAKQPEPPATPSKPAEPAKPRYSLVAQNMIVKAKALEKSRKLDSATKTYRDVVDYYPGTEQAAAAQARLKFLESK